MALFLRLVSAAATLVLSYILVAGSTSQNAPDKLAWVRFLVTVNDTWDPDGCIATVLTERIAPNTSLNHSQRIEVGSCDQGPLQYQFLGWKGGNMSIGLTFHSSVIVDASPPTCTITWADRYMVPTREGSNESLLPGCFTMESREGYHMTAYWFYLLDWALG